MMPEGSTMAKARYEYCDDCSLREWTEQRLAGLPPSVGRKEETPAAFWTRVEHAKRLVEALKIYDQVAAEYAGSRHKLRETKRDFAERMEREGRQAEANRLRAELVASGLSQREVQKQMVEHMQPLNGPPTRVHETLDPWMERLFRTRSDHERLLYVMQTVEDLDEAEDEDVVDARNRFAWAEHRRDERRALAAARQQARALKAAAVDSAPARPA
jgi:hypothetical protein